MLSRDALTTLNTGSQLIVGWLEEFIRSVPRLINQARAALQSGDAEELEFLMHELKDTIVFAGGTGQLKETVIEALQMCGTPSSPVCPTDRDSFESLLSKLDCLCKQSNTLAGALIEEFKA